MASNRDHLLRISCCSHVGAAAWLKALLYYCAVGPATQQSALRDTLRKPKLGTEVAGFAAVVAIS
jgi:hypothetical protein